MSELWLAYFLLAGLAIAQASVMLLAAWEHCRYSLSRSRRETPQAGPWPLVTVIAPCKGFDPEWTENVSALFEQDYPNFRLRFVVQSQDDPTYAALEALVRQFPNVSATIVVAGLAQGCAQKAHNLYVATAGLDAETAALAFVDSDARPPRHWLRALVHRLRKSGAAAVTGYRWFVPLRQTWANWFMVSLNAAAGGLLGPHRHNLIWGGSWLISRRTFEESGIRESWRHALSDDLVATRALHRLGLDVAFEPQTWLPAVADMSWRELASFARRQYILVRHHVPRHYWLALAGSTLRSSAFWLGVALLPAAALRGPKWFLGLAMLLAVQYVLMGFRAVLRQRAVVAFLGRFEGAMRSARWADVLAGPLVALFETILIWSSSWRRRITWRGIDYEIGRGGSIAVFHNSLQRKGLWHWHSVRRVQRAGKRG